MAVFAEQDNRKLTIAEKSIETHIERIAIVGMACRFPGGVSNPRALWANLVEGKDCITQTPADRYNASELISNDKSKSGRLVAGRGGYIDDFDRFDPAFFGISPREADHMDPQQRKLLEVAWEALEDAGQKPLSLAGRDVGVFVGGFTLDYKILQFSDLSFDTLAAHTSTGTMMTMLSNRISYCFDFRGPSLSIDTACSSSLVAVHLACQSLRRRECCLALAGAALLHMAPQYTIAETKGGFLSTEGKSRTFDAAANGYVRSEGVAMVALKRLDDAVRDGDPIHAVIIGSGVNQDGRTNGITVPNPDAQVRLIERVCAEAGIAPGVLQYVEAHGTSTPVGDPIEASALARVLAIGRPANAKCYVGSIKANMGHAEAAAGLAGLIKVTMSLKHGKIPPHINLETINPAIDLAAAPYEIPTRVTGWPEHDGPARAGVNSFGFGGANAHVLLEEAPERPAAGERLSRPAPRYSILPLTAHDETAFPRMVQDFRQELADGSRAEARAALQDVGYTLAHRRQHLKARLSFVYDTLETLDEQMAAFLASEQHPLTLRDERRAARPRLAWVFTGMGPQWWGMGRELFETEPVYREVVERCDDEIARLAGWSLIEELNASETDSHMSETWLAQPANFAVQAGLAALWRSRGVEPDAIVGHSTGEIGAFHAAGVYTFEEAVAIAIHRSRLQQTLSGAGGMLAVGLTESEAARWVEPYGGRVSIAAVNSPAAMTLAGDEDALSEIAAGLQAAQTFAKPLAVRVPYHSAKMEAIKDDLLASLAGLRPRAAQVPVYTTAQPGIAAGPELDAGYWWRNVRRSVGFRGAIDAMIDDGYDLFLEIGPHPVLAHSIRECSRARGAEVTVIPSIRRQEGEQSRFTVSLAALHNLGVEIDWSALHPAGRPVMLPGYPWKRDRYWVEPPAVEQIRLGRQDHPLLGRRMANAEPVWENRLDAERIPYLNDHRIEGNVVYPAAGYIEMAAQAALALSGGGAVAIADVEFRKALFLPETEAKTVQLSLATDGASFNISSLPAAGQERVSQERVVHACGVLRAGQRQAHQGVLDLDALKARARERLDGPACYQALAALGYSYGDAFQRIEEVWIAPGEALARVSPLAKPNGSGGVGPAAHYHPAMLDACFQTLLTPQLLRQRSNGAGVMLPLSLAQMRSEPIGARPIWVHATIAEANGEDEIVGDIALYSDDGAPLGFIEGFRAGNVETASAGVGVGVIDRWLAELAWLETPVIVGNNSLSIEDATAGPAAGRILILADGHGLGEALAALAAPRGRDCTLVRPGETYDLSEDRRKATVEPGNASHMKRLLAELRGEGAASVGAVVHLWTLDLPALDDAEPADLGVLCGRSAYSLVALAQALLEEPGGRLYVVTRGAQSVAPGEAAEPLAAPAWGVGRVLAHQDLAKWRGKLIDIDPAGRASSDALAAEAESLFREIGSQSDGEDEVAYRGGRRYISRLRWAEGLTRPLPLRLRSDGCYLVTGAFGALGQLLCRLLVRRGARKLLLVGRSTPPDRSQWAEAAPDSVTGARIRFVRELEAMGAEVLIAPFDITDEAAASAWLADFRRGGRPPIRGAFHLAGQVRDTLLADMDRETFDAAYAPKAAGALLLHRLLADDPLEHFVLFASVASLLTTAGQSNYAAGNAFLDALAHYRRSRGAPALSLDWGPWATGMIKELNLIDHYRKSRGMSSLAPQAGMDVLERVIGQDHAQLVVATIVDWPVFLAWYPGASLPIVQLLAETQNDAPVDEDGDFIDAYRGAAEEDRRPLLGERFVGLISQVLRVDAAKIDGGAGLSALGVDSLLAMELRVRMQTELGASVPLVTLLGAATVDDLTDQLHAELSERLAKEGEAAAAAAEAEQFDDRTLFPLTQNQKALWFLKQLSPDGFAYNIGGAVEVQVELQPEKMFRAVLQLVERHPLLRANFLLDKGQAVQRISPEPKPDLALIDVEGQPWDEIHRMIIREYRKPYDLENDSLFRFRLFRRGTNRWIIMKAVHHIISDAISTFTFIEELLAIYEGSRRGEMVALPAPQAHYLDFLNWQNRLLASPAAEKMFDYWRGHLPGGTPVLNLPTDKPRPAVMTQNGSSEFFVLERDLSQRIHALARENGMTVFMVLMSAYYALMHRYSGQDDIIIGSPVTGRTQNEFSSLYGYFVNPLPLHVDLSGEPSIAELLAQVQKVVLNGLDNQEYPFVLLVEKLKLQHDPSRSAVFQVMFILLAHKVATEKYGYRLEYIELPEEEGQFDLTLSVYEDEVEQRFHCVFKYNADLFFPETVRRMARCYVNLLDAMTRSPSTRPVASLPMLDAGEAGLILDRWSGAADRVEVGDSMVHELIAGVAAGRPEAVALIAPQEDGTTRRVSYGALEEEAKRLAGRLRERGVGRGAVVGLCMDKSPELIVALLATLKAGAAYLPLDPALPPGRLAYMASRAGAALVVVDEGHRERLSEWPGAASTLADLAQAVSGSASANGAGVDAAAMHDAAYVIFTSGSTGLPKATRVSHGSLASAYRAWEREYRLGVDARTHLQLASPAFDVFTGDWTRALCSGGALVLASRDLVFDTARLYEVMAAEGVDCAEFVPAVMRTLMNFCERENRRLDFMRLVIVGSDVWKAQEHRRLRDLCGEGVRVVNSYGLTEATIDSAYFEGSTDDLDPSQMTPIGRPFPNSALYILDPRQQPAPVGAPGELWIGGDGVADGYVGDDEETARRFRTVTLGQGAGERSLRLYRTGDLALWRPSGEIQLLGRMDAQVKIRGHRIETGEIEKQLAAWPAVSQAAVAARPDPRGDMALCAYCVPRSGESLNWRDLREHLGLNLPTYMIPAYFVELAELPLSANGKVDLGALPAPSFEAADTELDPPVTLYEVSMAGHWKRLLGHEQVGLQQDFFELGGSSIKLIELIYHLQSEFNISISVSHLFKVTTLRAMAKAVENISLGIVAGAQPYLRFNAGAGPVIFCFPPAGGHGLVYRKLAQHLQKYEIISFNYLAGDDKVALYADLIEAVKSDGEYALFGYSLGGNLAFEVAKELERRGREVSHVVIMDSLRIHETFEMQEEHFMLFEQELAEHFNRHVGSQIVAEETLRQAREYIRFCSRTPNVGVVNAPVTVIFDQEKFPLYIPSERGAWHGSSATRTDVLGGFGRHADMLDEGHVADNARLTENALNGEAAHVS